MAKSHRIWNPQSIVRYSQKPPMVAPRRLEPSAEAGFQRIRNISRNSDKKLDRKSGVIFVPDFISRDLLYINRA